MDFWFQIPGTGFQYLSVELGFWIPIVSGFRILWAVLQIPKHRISDSTSKNFSDSRIRIPLHGADYSVQMFTYLSFRRQQIRQLMVTTMNKTEADAIIPALTLGNNTVLSSLRPSLSNLGRGETWWQKVTRKRHVAVLISSGKSLWARCLVNSKVIHLGLRNKFVECHSSTFFPF